MLRLGVDLDDVIFALMEQWLGFYNEGCGDSIEKEDVRHFDLRKTRCKCGERIYQYLYDPRLHLECDVHEGATSAIAELLKSPDVDITFCTSAPRTVMPAKIHRLETLFPSSKHAYGFFLTNEKWRLGCDLYVEDCPKHCWDILLQTGARLLLFDQPWNRDQLWFVEEGESWSGHCRARRIRGWNGNAVELVKNLVAST